MKKMIYLAAFVIMMAMGNMNAFANKNGIRHNEVHMNGNGRIEVRYDAHHHDMKHGHKMSRHERRMMEKRRREEERRRMEEARRRREEHRRMEAYHHHVAHHNEVIVDNVAAGVVVGVSLAALIGALAK